MSHTDNLIIFCFRPTKATGTRFELLETHLIWLLIHCHVLAVHAFFPENVNVLPLRETKSPNIVIVPFIISVPRYNRPLAAAVVGKKLEEVPDMTVIINEVREFQQSFPAGLV